MGLDRTIAVLQGKASVYETDIFAPIIGKIESLSGARYGQDPEITRAFRIVADHLRTATFILGDERGVTPSNLDQGYVLRRLIRRAVRFGRKLAMPDGFTAEIAQVVIDQYGEVYPELVSNRDHILNELLQEENRFAKTIAQGLKEFDKLVGWMTKTGAEKVINGKTAFRSTIPSVTRWR